MMPRKMLRKIILIMSLFFTYRGDGQTEGAHGPAARTVIHCVSAPFFGARVF